MLATRGAFARARGGRPIRRRAGRRTAVLAVAGVVAALTAAAPAHADLARVGPYVPVDGNPDAVFPAWFEDANGLRLDLCLDGPMCLGRTQTMVAPDGEAFYFDATATVPTATGIAEYTAATEAAFLEPGSGQEMAFNRIRIRIDASTPGTYRVIHPYGVDTFEVTAADAGLRAVNFTEDVGCIPFEGVSCHDGVAPEFDPMSLSGRVDPWLRWAPDHLPEAPSGYIGDAVTPHEVVGSIVLDREGEPQNYFVSRARTSAAPGSTSSRPTSSRSRASSRPAWSSCRT
jgi:hypothetical protein